MILEHLRRVAEYRDIIFLFVLGSMVFSACITQPPVTTDQVPLSERPNVQAIVVDTVISHATDESQKRVLVVETPTPGRLPSEEGQIIYGITNQNPDGNRWVQGHGRLPDVEPMDIPLDGTPAWVVGAAMGEGSLWVVALEDGRIQAFQVVKRNILEFSIEPGILKPGMPPLLRIQDGNPYLITTQDPDASSLTHPAILDSQGVMVYITGKGDLVLWSEGELDRLLLSALPDSRILVNDVGDLLLLNQATDRYGHGVLGDTIEAAAMTLVEMNLDSLDVLEIQIPEPAVIEGIAPIWVDMNGDGEREIVVTISNAQHGAQLIVFDERGQQVATSEPIGRGFRWRHQIAVAPFGPSGEMELVSVRTPHIGGIVEFHRLEGNELKLMASLTGFTTHVIGSRNLDMSVAGDFDGDGMVEILIPDQSLSRLAGLRRIPGGVEENRSLALDGTLNTNLAALSMDMNMGVGVGMREGFLRLWLP